MKKILQQLLPGISAIALTGNLAMAESLRPQSLQNQSFSLNSYKKSTGQESAFSFSDLPQELQIEGKWHAFKTLWQSLDTIVPVSSKGSVFDGKALFLFDEVKGQWPVNLNFQLPKYKERLYYQALDQQKMQDFQNKLTDIFGRDTESLSPESKLLYRLTWLRIYELSSVERLTPDYRQDDSSLMTRMGPVFYTSTISPTYYLVSAVDRIQMRANTLQELRETGVIDDEIYASTIDALLADAKLVLYLDMLTGQYLDQTKNNQIVTIDKQAKKSLISFVSSDFEKNDSGQAHIKVDLRENQTWLNALNLAYHRRGNNKNLFVPDSSEQIKQLMYHLSLLREDLNRLDPLLTKLEQR